MSFLRKILSKKEEPAGEQKKESKEKEKETASVRSSGFEKFVNVIGKPHVTEKTSRGANGGMYAFSVFQGVNKRLVKEAVETRYEVKVQSVRIANMPGKIRRRGRQVGMKPGFKKAMVTLKEGYSIDLS